MNIDILLTELSFKAVRSSGPGGQHVNKTASKVEITFNLYTSQAFSEEEKMRLLHKLSNRLTTETILMVQCSETRSQHRNKTIGIERLVSLIKENLKVKKPRKKSRPSRNSIEKGIKAKKTNALKKQNRKPPQID